MSCYNNPYVLTLACWIWKCLYICVCAQTGAKMKSCFRHRFVRSCAYTQGATQFFAVGASPRPENYLASQPPTARRRFTRDQLQWPRTILNEEVVGRTRRFNVFVRPSLPICTGDRSYRARQQRDRHSAWRNAYLAQVGSNCAAISTLPGTGCLWGCLL